MKPKGTEFSDGPKHCLWMLVVDRFRRKDGATLYLVDNFTQLKVIKSENRRGFSIQFSDMGRQSESIGAKGLTNFYLVNTFQGFIQ